MAKRNGAQAKEGLPFTRARRSTDGYTVYVPLDQQMGTQCMSPWIYRWGVSQSVKCVRAWLKVCCMAIVFTTDWSMASLALALFSFAHSMVACPWSKTSQ